MFSSTRRDWKNTKNKVQTSSEIIEGEISGETSQKDATCEVNGVVSKESIIHKQIKQKDKNMGKLCLQLAI